MRPNKLKARSVARLFVGRLFVYLAGLKSPNFVVGYSGSELEIGLARGNWMGASTTRIPCCDEIRSRPQKAP